MSFIIVSNPNPQTRDTQVGALKRSTGRESVGQVFHGISSCQVCGRNRVCPYDAVSALAGAICSTLRGCDLCGDACVDGA